jgi:hypothetical protein
MNKILIPVISVILVVQRLPPLASDVNDDEDDDDEDEDETKGHANSKTDHQFSCNQQ